MQLFLVPADPMQTVLVSSTGEPQYVVQTDKIYDSGTRARRVTTVRKLPETESGSVLSDLDSITEESGASGKETDVVAEIAWKTWGTSTTVYGNLSEGMQAGVRVQEFMCKRGQFSRGMSVAFSCPELVRPLGCPDNALIFEISLLHWERREEVSLAEGLERLRRERLDPPRLTS
jgi:hypothetical protein